ncbi:hypothetical protein QQX98_004400 [Neonectria punicea]|uniref:Xylanolytic transcriptional activator regulatory domain-containing protein n=1 Tax=Neonectria punicea TaxID=979145 RepID=A0ABR1H9D0_9HYPO
MLPVPVLAPETPGDDPDADSPQIYGATSLLYDQASNSPLANFVSKGGEPEDEHSKDVLRDRLICYAAIQRQQEMALHSSPSITANIDFDGVPADMAMHLLDLHWNRQHQSYLLTYRPAIMDSLARNGPYVNKLLLNAIYLQSSLYSDRNSLRSDPKELHTIGNAFHDRFKALLPQLIDKSTIPTVVALVTCGASLVPRGKQSAGWVFCGIAYRMLADIGCHLNLQSHTQNGLTSRETAIDIEMRRRAYWGAYVGDKFQSLFLGRPPAMPRAASNVSREYLDSYEEMEEWKPYVDPSSQPFDAAVPAYRGRPSYALSTFNCLLRLCDIAEGIIDAFYSVDSAEAPETTLFQKRDEIREQLSQWKACLPSWLQFDPTCHPTPPPHQITPQYDL